MRTTWRLAAGVALAGLAALVAAGVASAHARISPSIVEKGADEVFTLAVPTEKEGVTTTRIELTVPSDFPIDSVAQPPPGWRMQVRSTGSGEEEAIESVTWSGGHVPTGQAATFGFAAGGPDAKTYRFSVRQTYSDGSVVDWNGPESSDDPAPSVQVLSSLGGGGVSTVEIVALVLAIVAIALAGVALAVGRGGRPLT